MSRLASYGLAALVLQGCGGGGAGGAPITPETVQAELPAEASSQASNSASSPVSTPTSAPVTPPTDAASTPPTTLNGRTLVWNGPLGAFETPPFDAATVALAGIKVKHPDWNLPEADILVDLALAFFACHTLTDIANTAATAFTEYAAGRFGPGVKGGLRGGRNGG